MKRTQQQELNRHLLTAIQSQDLKEVMRLIEGIDINEAIHDSRTCLHWALMYDNIEMVEALISAGADVNVLDRNEMTPLHLAIEKGNENIVKALLAVDGINVNLQDKYRQTPLYLAAWKGKMEIVEALLAKKPDIDLPNKYGHTPLYVAAEGSHHKVVRALLEKGADPLVKGRCNKNLAEMVTEDAIMRGIVYGVGIFVIASVVAAIVVTSAYFIGVSLSVGAMAGITVAAAVLTGLVAGGIIYEVYKPCNELKEAIAQAMSNLGKKLNGVDV